MDNSQVSGVVRVYFRGSRISTPWPIDVGWASYKAAAQNDHYGILRCFFHLSAMLIYIQESCRYVPGGVRPQSR